MNDDENVSITEEWLTESNSTIPLDSTKILEFYDQNGDAVQLFDTGSEFVLMITENDTGDFFTARFGLVGADALAGQTAAYLARNHPTRTAPPALPLPITSRPTTHAPRAAGPADV